jgi:hypothetical protein
LVGDAASFIDPLTSQGVYKAMQSGIMAAAVINTVTHRRQDAALAKRYYQDAQEAFVKNYAAITVSMYRASVFEDEPFWKARIPDAPKTFVSRPALSDAFIETVRRCGGDQIHLQADTSRFRIQIKGRASRGFVVPVPVLVGDAQDTLDLVDLELDQLIVLLDGRSMASVFEAYAQATGSSPSNTLAKHLRDGLSAMIEREWLGYRTHT